MPFRARHRDSVWVFDLGANLYAWFTAQSLWHQSCAALVGYLPPGDNLRVVDLGCGPGVSTFEMARLRPSHLYAGLDRAGRMLQQARRRQRRARLAPAARIAWLQADAISLPFQSASLDALTGHSFLYLLPRRAQALAEMRRVLRPGGRLVLMEPNKRGASVRDVLALSRDPRHLVSVSLWRPFSRLHGQFTAASLASALAAAGFREVSVQEVLGGLGLLARADRPAEP